MFAKRVLLDSLRFRPLPLKQRVAHYYLKPKKKKGPSTQAWLALAGVSATLTGVGIYVLGQPEEQIAGLDSEPDKYANENVVKAYLMRAWDSVMNYRKKFADPSSEKLLPDLLPPQYQRPYTLVLEMKDVLIHSEYDRRLGWKYQKRPGVDALLVNAFDNYEIVIFTSENAMSANPILTAMDPNQLVIYHLYRDATKYINGTHVKDLTNLNRSLNKVIFVDTDPQSVRFHRENSIILEKWTGDITDRTLWDLIPILHTIAVNEVDDVRPVLDYYKSNGEKKILETFKSSQAQLKEEAEKLREEQQRMISERQGYHLGGAIPTFHFSPSLSRRRESSAENTTTAQVRMELTFII